MKPQQPSEQLAPGFRPAAPESPVGQGFRKFMEAGQLPWSAVALTATVELPAEVQALPEQSSQA